LISETKLISGERLIAAAHTTPPDYEALARAAKSIGRAGLLLTAMKAVSGRGPNDRGFH
jgi:hypothetical protein